MTAGPIQGTLLIVDDERGGREALEGLLLNQGYRLAFAAGGQEAVQLISELLPDLILLDVMMPGMDGFAVCRHLRADPITAEIPVLLVTALDDRETRLEGISAGADDFISKPYDRAELRLRVKTIMRIGRYRRLLTQRARFNSVVEGAANGYVVVRDDGTISYANQAARRFLTLEATTPNGDLGGFFETARRYYRLEPDVAWKDEDLRIPNSHFLVRPETATAGAFWLAVTLMDAPNSESGERLLRLRDVTEERGVQRDRHSFHRIIGHKLRTPLNGMVSMLEMLKADLDGNSQGELAALALESAERLARSVEEILQFASLSSERGTKDEPFPLPGLPEVVARLQKETEITTLESEIDPSLLQEAITLSPLQFETVCRELLENARKFHPRQQPALKLAAARGTNRTLRLTLRDDGLNLAPDQLAQVWTPYYQGEKRTTGEVVGMGLGLSVVKSIIVSKGGSIKMLNNPDGPGVELTLDLPLVRAVLEKV
jgi:two-component system cell cycle response regulator